MVAMTPRRRKRLLVLANLLLAAALLAVVWAVVLGPLEVPEAVATGDHQAGDATVPAPAGGAVGPLSDYACIYGKDLRKRLFDVADKGRPVPKLHVVLTGAVVEPGSTYGVFRDGAGRTRLLSVGESVDGAKIVTITADSATLEYHGREIILAKKRRQGP